MKTVFLIMATAMLISTCGNCQWFERRYGADDIYQLSNEQLHDDYKRAKAGVIIWGINGTRLQTIKGIMNNAEIKLGVLNFSSSNYSGDFNCSSMPGFSILFKF